MKLVLAGLICFFLILKAGAAPYSKAVQDGDPVAFSQADRDRIIRMEAILEQHDKRFDNLDKRFDDVNKRIDQTRDELNKRIDQTNTTIGWLTALFTAIVIATFSFALWDRRSMVRPFETKVKEIETNIELKGTRMEKILYSLRELAKTDNKLADILRTHHLL